MAALDFPNSPTVNQTWAAPNGALYKWDGTAWILVGTNIGIPDAPTDGALYGRGGTTPAWAKALPLGGGQLSGPLLLAADPTSALAAATKQYVDNNYLSLAGGSLSGALLLAADPLAALGAATKQYVDNRVASASYLPIAGGTLTGPLILQANPTAALGAATKQYVDAATVISDNRTQVTVTGAVTTAQQIGPNIINVALGQSVRVRMNGELYRGAASCDMGFSAQIGATVIFNCASGSIGAGTSPITFFFDLLLQNLSTTTVRVSGRLWVVFAAALGSPAARSMSGSFPYMVEATISSGPDTQQPLALFASFTVANASNYFMRNRVLVTTI